MNIRQDRFAELVASGVPATRAYAEAGYSNRGKNADANAARMMVNDGVKARIAEIRAKTSAKLELKRENLARHPYAAVMTPIGDIDEKSPLAQEMTTLDGKRRIKTMGKVESATLLCRMMGWLEPEQHVVDTGPSTLDAIRERARNMASPLSRIKTPEFPPVTKA